MVPHDLQPQVDRALTAAFGTTTIDDLAALRGGMRARLACRVVVRGRPYFLRIGATTLVDPAQELARTRRAADAGLAPRVLYASAEDSVLITDFIASTPLTAELAPRIAAMVARIHAQPPSGKTIHVLDMIEGFVARARTAGIELDREVLAGHAEVAAAYPREAVVACHNDLKPQNILFDGDRIWIVDWEAGFQNDRYADLAIVANFLVATDADEARYLAGYFGAPPTELECARFTLIRFANHVAYVALLSLLAPRAPDPPTPDPRAFHAGLLAGTIELHDEARKRQYAGVHLAMARAEMASPKFTAALARVRAG